MSQAALLVRSRLEGQVSSCTLWNELSPDSARYPSHRGGFLECVERLKLCVGTAQSYFWSPLWPSLHHNLWPGCQVLSIQQSWNLIFDPVLVVIIVIFAGENRGVADFFLFSHLSPQHSFQIVINSIKMFRAFICPKLAMETKVTRMFSLLIIIVKRVTLCGKWLDRKIFIYR